VIYREMLKISFSRTNRPILPNWRGNILEGLEFIFLHLKGLVPFGAILIIIQKSSSHEPLAGMH